MAEPAEEPDTIEDDVQTGSSADNRDEKIVKEARIKRKAKESKESLKELLNDPTLLIGKRIKHRVQESTEEDPEWYDESVLEIDKYTDETVRTI